MLLLNLIVYLVKFNYLSALSLARLALLNQNDVEYYENHQIRV